MGQSSAHPAHGCWDSCPSVQSLAKKTATALRCTRIRLRTGSSGIDLRVPAQLFACCSSLTSEGQPDQRGSLKSSRPLPPLVDRSGLSPPPTSQLNFFLVHSHHLHPELPPHARTPSMRHARAHARARTHARTPSHTVRNGREVCCRTAHLHFMRI